MSRSPIREWMAIEIDPWFSSPAVQAMRDFQRWWYMSLLLRAWQADPPCHLPNDHNRLWMLAGAPSLDVWQKHSAIVTGQFDATGDGKWLVNKKQAQFYEEKLAIALKNHNRAISAASGRWGKNASSIQEGISKHDSASVSPSCVCCGKELNGKSISYRGMLLCSLECKVKRYGKAAIV